VPLNSPVNGGLPVRMFGKKISYRVTFKGKIPPCHGATVHNILTRQHVVELVVVRLVVQQYKSTTNRSSGV